VTVLVRITAPGSQYDGLTAPVVERRQRSRGGRTRRARFDYLLAVGGQRLWFTEDEVEPVPEPAA
jgi:hypothetical protein